MSVPSKVIKALTSSGVVTLWAVAVGGSLTPKIVIVIVPIDSKFCSSVTLYLKVSIPLSFKAGVYVKLGVVPAIDPLVGISSHSKVKFAKGVNESE